MSRIKVAGIDFSMSSPAITTFEGNYPEDELSFDNCKSYYFTDKKKFDMSIDNINGTLAPKYTDPMERFDNLAKWTYDCVHDCDYIGLEGYAMGAKGKVFHIGENTGIMKHLLWQHGLSCEIIAPSVIKKFAFGKGNAKKEQMQESFISETGIDLKAKLQQTQKQWSPSGDIIDSYYIAQYMWNNIE